MNIKSIIPRIITLIMAVVVAFAVTGCASTQSEAPTPADEDYLPDLEGITVTTTLYHPEVEPIPPGSRYPETFYDPILVGSVPPDVTGSITLPPFGHSSFPSPGGILWVTSGQTIDILLEADWPIYVGDDMDKAGTITATVNTGTSIAEHGRGVWDHWGFFYEAKQTKVLDAGGSSKYRYSTALRVIILRAQSVGFWFKNYVPEDNVDVKYSIWKGRSGHDYEGYWRQLEKSWDKYYQEHGVEEAMRIAMRNRIEQAIKGYFILRGRH